MEAIIAKYGPGAMSFAGFDKFHKDKGKAALARCLLVDSAELNHPAALVALANETEYPATREYFLHKAANLGYAIAYRELAALYRRFKNYEQENEYLRLAADLGDYRSGLDLALHVLENDEGHADIPEDEALKVVERIAMKRHSVLALTKAAFFYGDSTKPYYDLDKAITLWEMSAVPGNPESCYYLAIHYRHLAEEQEDPESANEFFEKALRYAHIGADKGDMMTSWQLGFTLMSMERYDEALEVFSKRSELGEGKATRTVGLFYSKGLGREKDWKKAMPYFEKAVKQGYKGAEYDVGLGHSLAGDREEAVKHYVSALEAGYLLSAVRLAELLEEEGGDEKTELASRLRAIYENGQKKEKPLWE